jgi:hypothetical protein
LSSTLEFTNYVFEKVVAVNKDKNIFLDQKSNRIDIEKELVLLTNFKNIDLNNKNSFKNDVEFGFEFLNQNSLKELYLIYPKNENFKKHLTILNKSQDKKIKLVPYKIDN